MYARKVFEYATIRVVPDIERGEFLVVGVISVSYTHLTLPTNREV